MSKDPKTQQPRLAELAIPVYVGIGASAGGLEATKELVRSLPTSQTLAYILAQHLSPKHTSLLVDLIGRETSLKVVEICDGITVEPGHIYITPPNRDVEMSQRQLSLHEPRAGHVPKPDINRLFSSMARDQGRAVIGIILSGTGNDGAQGIAEIKTAGGVTIVQTPSTCKYDGMPKAAITSERIDLILPPNEIGHMLASLVDAETANTFTESSDQSPNVYEKILDLTHRTSAIDLTNYRVSTILRRIHRRMAIRQVESMARYLEIMQADSDEVSAFIRDAFISVTGFFRDAHAFSALEKLIRQRVERAAEQSSIRIWVPGCATGEEAYSIALLLQEAIQDIGRSLSYRVFATDIAPKAINKARQGLYRTEDIEGVPPVYLEKYFTQTHETYQIDRVLREHCVFSVHDVTRDPPFSRMDLISCRNLLIYFDSTLQERVLERFHYALRPEGYLILGKSETVHTAVPLFKPHLEQERLYQRQEYPGYPRLLHSELEGLDQRTQVDSQEIIRREKYSVESLFTQQLAKRFSPAAVLINENNEMVHAHGDISAYFAHKAGPCVLDVFASVKEFLRPGLRALIYKSRREARLVEQIEDASRTESGQAQVVRIQVQPFLSKHPDWLILSFEQLDKPNLLDSVNALEPHETTVDETMFHEMEHELLSTRESLQTVIQELETTNEELQSTNEELQSANEEFISTNEEFQTTNEELSSSNEELMTLNDELENKTKHLQELNLHLQAIQDSLETPLLVVNHKLRLRRFGPAIDKLIPIEDVKENDLVTALPWRTAIEHLERDLHHVIDNGHDIVRLVPFEAGFYQLQMTPYQSTLNEQKGAVMIFADATRLVHTQEAYRRDKEYLEVTLQAIADGVIRCDAEGRIDYLNPVAETLLEVSDDEAKGLCLEEILHIEPSDKHDVSQGKENLALAAIRAGKYIYGSEDHLIRTKRQSELYLQYAAAPIIRDKTPIGAVIAFRDYTRQFETLEQMKWRSSHDMLTGLVNRHELDQRLARMAAKCQKSEYYHAALFYMDLDRFKMINDSVGHLAGDELLRQITREISQMLRSRDTLARLGGDEFGVLVDDCSLKDAVHIAEKILAAVSQYQFHWDGRVFTLGVSIGIVMIGGECLSEPIDILKAADQACQRAKNQGRNRIEVYTGGDEESRSQRLELEWVSELSGALQEDRFRLYFQPISAPSNGNKTRSWEVLLRFFNREGELLTPGAFLSPAERYGLMPKLDIWAFKAVLSLLDRYRPASRYARIPRLHLNISAYTLQDSGYLDTMKQAITTFDVNPEHIYLEIDESTALTHYSAVQDFCHQVSQLGVQVGLDDFTANITSYDYLQALKVQYVKISPAILQTHENPELSRINLAYIRDLCALQKIDVVAKWIDDPTKIQLVNDCGLELCQGNAISPPLPSEEFLHKTH
ncbi:MAG: EAL domain-containing protein [Candidatus Thiodiazotropha taylori]|nr:EAL domain-containing protein [Candidatus Thiodiazotropha taylori]